MELSPKLRTYIKFASIKNFVDDMCTVYDDKALKALSYKMLNIDILEEGAYFVDIFQDCWKMKKKIIFCDGIYFDIPSFIERNDDNSEIIKAHLEYLEKLYKDPSICPEFKFMMSNSNLINKFKKPLSEPSDCIKNAVEVTLKELIPTINVVKAEFKKRKLVMTVFTKILLIFVDDIVDAMEDCVEKTSLKNILRIFLEVEYPIHSVKDINAVQFIKEISNVEMMKSYIPMIRTFSSL